MILSENLCDILLYSYKPINTIVRIDIMRMRYPDIYLEYINIFMLNYLLIYDGL